METIKSSYKKITVLNQILVLYCCEIFPTRSPEPTHDRPAQGRLALGQAPSVAFPSKSLGGSGSTPPAQGRVPRRTAVPAAFRGSEPLYLLVQLSSHPQRQPFLGLSPSFFSGTPCPSFVFR